MKSGDRRAAIVECASQLFAEKGFRGTTTRELAAALHVTEPVLYQHFKTKRDLYTAILEAHAEGDAARVERVRTLAAAGSDRAFFTAAGELIVEHAEANPGLYRLLLFSALERHELGDIFFERVVAGVFKLVSSYIRRRIREGAFRKVNPDTAARGLLGMFHFHTLIGMLHPGGLGKVNRKRLVPDLVAVFLDGLAPTPTGR
jgi:AcrR family transcriptional regulator